MSSYTTVENSSFDELGLPATITATLKKLEYHTPTPIQAEAIPILLAGDDIIGQAQTGTGKTAAFALPALSKLNITNYYPQILVLVPTRELAIQVAAAFTEYSVSLGNVKVLAIYGGQAYGQQLSSLKQGVHVIIGTPGRIMDHIGRKTLDLSRITTLILDEADEMLKMGFIDDVETIIKQAPKKRQIALFSATMPAAIRAIADRHLHKPKNVIIKASLQKNHTIKQCYWEVKSINKIDALSRILEVEEIDAVLVFVKTKKATEELAEQLLQRKFAVVALNGDIVQQQRERIIKLLKGNKVNIVIATDVAARGLDIDRISHVINYELPNNIDSYTHRIGRTGRAGRFGVAISFVAPREKYFIRNIERVTKYSLEQIELPSVQAVNDKRIAKFQQRITDTLAKEDLGVFESLILQYQDKYKVSALSIAASLAKLLNVENEFLLIPGKHKAADNNSTGSYAKKMSANLETYRVEIGKEHGAKAADIISLIESVAGIEGQYIGKIELRRKFSLIDLPGGMTRDTYNLLKKAMFGERKLKLTRLNGIDRNVKKRDDKYKKKKRRVARV